MGGWGAPLPCLHLWEEEAACTGLAARKSELVQFAPSPPARDGGCTEGGPLPLKGLVLSGLVLPASCRAVCTSAPEPARLGPLELVSEGPSSPSGSVLARLPPWALCGVPPPTPRSSVGLSCRVQCTSQARPPSRVTPGATGSGPLWPGQPTRKAAGGGGWGGPPAPSPRGDGLWANEAPRYKGQRSDSPCVPSSHAHSARWAEAPEEEVAEAV